MTSDGVDQAFLARWNALACCPAAPAACLLTSVEPSPLPALPPAPAAVPTAEPAAPDLVPAVPVAAADDPVDRLLATAADEWAGLADEIEAARRRGRRIVAITSSERAAGCSALVEGLVRILRRRGRDAVGLPASALPVDGPGHDKRIVLVDAGVWFPPGRISRQRLLVTTAGCDAAILVRKAGRPAPAAWGPALQAIGVEPLGEVISCAPGEPAPTASGDSP